MGFVCTSSLLKVYELLPVGVVQQALLRNNVVSGLW